MDPRKQTRLAAYGVVGVLFLFNFFICYISFSARHNPKPPTSVTVDKLSGEEYTPTTNEENPFGPYFVGFDYLADRGVSSDQLRYIFDVLTNYTMYSQHLYKAKVSYVKGSFERVTVSGIEPHFKLKFGINDARIHTLDVTANILTEKITTNIYSQNGDQQLFNRTFQLSVD